MTEGYSHADSYPYRRRRPGGPVQLDSPLAVRRALATRRASPSTSIHPKATGISTRTMELFRAWGIEPRVREAAMSVEFVSSVRDNLAAPEVERRPLGFPNRDEAAAFSPTDAGGVWRRISSSRSCSTTRAAIDSAEVRFNTEVCDLDADARRRACDDRRSRDRRAHRSCTRSTSWPPTVPQPDSSAPRDRDAGCSAHR